LAFFFIMSGYISYTYALRIKGTAFYTIVLSTMFMRMIIMIFLIIVWIRYLSDDTTVFLLSLIFWYALLIIPEIMSFNRMSVKERY
jgi:hypothetical protein